MPDKIFLITGTAELKPLTEQMYEKEDLLQQLLENYPDLLAGDQIDSSDPRRWVLVKREMGVGDGESDRWSLDHLFLDQSGILTLVEVKRSTDTRIRREVVGQMLDYAANAVLHWPFERIRSSFDETCRQRGVDPSAEISGLLVLPPDQDVLAAVESFWLSVKTNLEAERIRMVFVADVVPPQLRRIVEFLNGQMNPAEVLAVELKQFVGQNVRTLVPRVLGHTAKAEMQKSAGVREPGRDWDEESFLAAVREESPESIAVMQKLIEWFSVRAGGVKWGRGKGATFTGRGVFDGESRELVRVFSDGRIMYSLPFLPEPMREPLRQKLMEVQGLILRGTKDHPAGLVSVLADPQKWKQLTLIYDALLRGSF